MGSNILKLILAVFSGLVLAIFVHLYAPIGISGLNQLAFLIANYVSMSTSAIILIIDVSEGVTKAGSPKYAQ